MGTALPELPAIVENQCRWPMSRRLVYTQNSICSVYNGTSSTCLTVFIRPMGLEG